MGRASNILFLTVLWVVAFLIAPLAVPGKYIAGLELAPLARLGAGVILLLMAAAYFCASTRLSRVFSYWHPIGTWLLLCVLDNQLYSSEPFDSKNVLMDRLAVSQGALWAAFVLVLLIALSYRKILNGNFHSIGRPDWVYPLLAILSVFASANFALKILFDGTLNGVVAFDPFRYGLGFVIPLYYILAFAMAGFVYVMVRRSRT